MNVVTKQKFNLDVNGVVGYHSLVHYSASKAGIVGFTRSAALELAQHGIRINAIAPGLIETPGVKVVGEETVNHYPLKWVA